MKWLFDRRCACFILGFLGVAAASILGRSEGRQNCNHQITDAESTSQPTTQAMGYNKPSGTGIDARRPKTVNATDPSMGIFSWIDNFHAVEAGRLYRSAQLSPETLQSAIGAFGIRTVVNLRGANATADWYRRERDACETAGVSLVDIRLRADECPTRENLLLLFDTFENSAEPLLIHCAAGADRTGAAAAIWRMCMLGDSATSASDELSFRYGHLSWYDSTLDFLITVFQPDKNWIENDFGAWERCRVTRRGTLERD